MTAPAGGGARGYPFGQPARKAWWLAMGKKLAYLGLSESRVSWIFAWSLGATSVAFAVPTTVEVLDARNVNQRIWLTTEQVESFDRWTGEVRTAERVSQVIEVGDFLCYRDPVRGWVPS